MYAIIAAILIATAPNAQPENVGAFFTEDGPNLCLMAAATLNLSGSDTLYVCEVQHE